MIQSLSINELKVLEDQVKSGGVQSARQVYDLLLAKGYAYAGWAAGVASGTTVAGQSALQFLQGTALLGESGSAAKALSPAQVDKLRVDMALGYLSTLITVANRNGGFVNRDVRFDETRAFHEKAFEANGLSIKNWTLDTPMRLIAAKQDAEKVEELWARVRDTAGTGLSGTMAGLELSMQIDRLMLDPSKSVSEEAARWVDQTPGIANFSQMGRALATIKDSLFNYDAAAPSVTSGDVWKDYSYKNGVSLSVGVLPYDTTDFEAGSLRVGEQWVFYSSVLTAPDGLGNVTKTYFGRTGVVTQVNDKVVSYNSESESPTGLRLLTTFDGAGKVQSSIQRQGLNSGGFIDLVKDASGSVSVHFTDSNGAAGVNGVGGVLNLDWNASKQTSYGAFDPQFYNDVTRWTSNQLLNGGGSMGFQTNANFGAVIPPSQFGLPSPSFGSSFGFGDPIGAFYDSQSEKFNAAAGIGAYMPVVLDGNLKAVTAAQLAKLDVDHDGNLSIAESAGLKFWRDQNEQGIADGNEVSAVDKVISAADFGLFTQGNGNAMGSSSSSAASSFNREQPRSLGIDVSMRAAGAAPMVMQPFRQERGLSSATFMTDTASYLRRLDTRYTVNANTWIEWTSTMVMISSDKTKLIGTDGNDRFDASYYASYTQYFNVDLLTKFYAGAGNDVMGGSVRNDQLFGGTGNDTLWGYQGDDTLKGEEGADEIQGDEGNDLIEGGADNDRLFGQVGNDTIAGGDGNDVMVGFTASNDVKQSLAAGETDDDKLYGEGGDDSAYGGLGNDYLDGGEGNDALYGEEDADNLFGQAGNDTLVGGDGDDFLNGFTASNETRQTLNPGETDDDKLLGGNGRDTLVGGFGNDLLDGGADADVMAGGKGNDIYVVNSVNDSVYEAADEGYDIVQSSTSYLLNANVEELRLIEGFASHGTGNALDNTIIGNSADNILDGVTGADTMVGAAGNDTYYVDNAADKVVEMANEGVDTVQASVNYTLGANVENMILLDFAKPEQGLVDGKPVLVYGYPKRNELDYMQGDAVPDSDRIVENDDTFGNRDVARFAKDVSSDQLWFRQSGNDLEVSIVGSHDQFVIDNWYGGSQHHVEQFKAGDGKWLSESGVQSLVEAMASFSPPAAGDITLPPNYNASLQTQIAANWH